LIDWLNLVAAVFTTLAGLLALVAVALSPFSEVNDRDRLRADYLSWRFLGITALTALGTRLSTTFGEVSSGLK
jgi:hypothetical protein